MKEFVEKLVKEIVDRPEEVVVEENLENVRMPLLELKVAKEDMGKVIGKRGKMIEALRILLAAASKKHKKEYQLIVVDQD
ncbi:KH domain-containing protein [Desulfothermus sp.]